MEVGHKLICVNATFDLSDSSIPREYKEIKIPYEGDEYTIRQVVNTEYGTGVRLEEIKNKEIHHDRGGLQEPIFSISRFRLSTR